MSKDEARLWVVCFMLIVGICLALFGCTDPRRIPHEPGTYDCCVKAWLDPNQEIE